MHGTDQIHRPPSAPNDDVKALVAGNNAFVYDLYQALRNGGSNGNGAAALFVRANATTYWQKANDHADKLARAEVSALAKQVITNQLSWQEVQSRLDNWIDAATLTSFGAGNDKAASEKASLAVFQRPMTERTSDPLDELFE